MEEPTSHKLSETEIEKLLQELPDWKLNHGKLHREYQFENFVQAFGFMTSVALTAESMNHHPEWFNVYHKVVVDLSTHSADGITNLDAELARKMEGLVQQT